MSSVDHDIMLSQLKLRKLWHHGMNYENIFYDVQVYAYRMGYLMESNKNVLKRLETLCVVLVKLQTRLRWRCEGVSTRPKKKKN